MRRGNPRRRAAPTLPVAGRFRPVDGGHPGRGDAWLAGADDGFPHGRRPARGQVPRQPADTLIVCGENKEALLAFLHAGQRWSGLLPMAQLDHINRRKSVIDTVTAIALEGPARRMAGKPPMAENDHRGCSLGRWYYGPGQRFAGQPVFDQLESIHRDLHETARRLEAEAMAGTHLNQLVGAMRELTEYSIEVVALLQGLQNVALMQCGEPPA